MADISVTTDVGAKFINTYVGEGPHLIIKPPEADKFGVMVLVASEGEVLVREGDHVTVPVDPPEFPPTLNVTDGSGVIRLDGKGESGPRLWRVAASVVVTAWGFGKKSVLTVVWVEPFRSR